ncbi:ATP-binding protein [Verrucomicrobiaceae bacterium R5-34]|nr:ATP-binding protein [Verrucomicrobiaceae bacterium R5-34]
MRTLPLLALLALLYGVLPLLAAATPLSELKLSQLEQRLQEIDAELSQLAHPSLRTGVGSIGYRSARHETNEHTEWVQINLGEVCALDEIILVPNIYRDSEEGFQADGFPTEFRIITGTSPDDPGTLLGEYSSATSEPMGIAPRILPAYGVKASWVRIEATELSLRAFDKYTNAHYLFQLAEVFVYSNGKNVALHRPVQTSSQHHEISTSPWNSRFLVDGFTPYLMNAAQGLQSVAYISKPNQSSVLTIDLESESVIDRIQLHALEQSDTVPQAHAGDLGIPHYLRIEGASRSDFSDSVSLLEQEMKSSYETGPIMMWNIPATRCRYVRIIDNRPANTFRIGFAEIQLFSNNHNVALGKKVSTTGEATVHRSLEALTDGRNLYGAILPIKDWMHQLTRRQKLDTERLSIAEELTRRYASQKTNLRWISWFAAILLVGTLSVIWFSHISRQRAIARTRERIAANLHDELGANLHAIGLLGDFAKRIVARKNATDEWAELNEVIDEVRSLTEETGETARYCTNMLETKEIHANLVGEMQQATTRLLADLDYETSFPEQNILHQLKPRRRIDLYLFYKECLTNIIRHSGATRVTAELIANENLIRLTVRDNGVGVSEAQAPESLRRRAKMLGGSVLAENLATGGSQITLQLRPRRRSLFNRTSTQPHA